MATVFPRRTPDRPALQVPVLTEGDRLVCGALKVVAILCAVLGAKAGLDIAFVVAPRLALRLFVALIGFCLFDGIRIAWQRRSARRLGGQTATGRRRIGFRGIGASEEAVALEPPDPGRSRAFRGRIGFVTEE